MSEKAAKLKMELIAKMLKGQHNTNLAYQYNQDRMVFVFRKNDESLNSEISYEYVDDHSENEIIERILSASEGDKIYNIIPATQTTIFPTGTAYDFSGQCLSGTFITDYPSFSISKEDEHLFKKFKIKRKRKKK